MAFSEPQNNLYQFDLQPGMKVADFGAGTGFYTVPAARIVGEGGFVYAIEVQKDLVEKLKAEIQKEHVLTNVKTVWGDIEERHGTTLEDATVDRVIISNVLFITDSKDGVFQEAFRVLRNGGTVLVVDWTDSFGGLGPQPENIVMQSTVEEIAERNGFSKVRDIDAGEHHFGVIFSKGQVVETKETSEIEVSMPSAQ